MSEKPTFGNGEENQDVTTSYPHSGGENVPASERERPALDAEPISPSDEDEEFPEDPSAIQKFLDNDPIEHLNAASVVKNLRESHRQPLSTGKKVGLGAVAFGGIAGTTVLVLSATGVIGGVNKNEAPTELTNPDATAPVTSGETQAPTVAPTAPEVTPSPTDIPTTFEPTPSATEAPSTPSETEQGSEYTASELREMPVNDYLALSATEREPLVTAMLEQSKDWSGEFGESFIANEETDRPISDLYKFNPLDIASEDNSAKEIAMQHLYWMQLGLMQTEDLDTSGTFDPDIATKALAGGFTQPGYVTGGGQDSLTKGMNAEFDYWKSTFSSLDTVTSHDYAQKISDAEFVDEGNIRNNHTGERHKVVSISFTTEALPETLADSYVAGTKTVGNLSFVWNEDLNRWQAYKGLTENRPVGQ